MAGVKWQRFRLDIPTEYGPRERQAIAGEVIDFILKRTKAGVDVNGQQFQKYSKKYMKSRDFRIGGKSGKVDLTLSGDMLSAVDLLSHKKGTLLIGIPQGDHENNAKATGNQEGTYGNPRPVTKPRRFLGIQKKDVSAILAKYPIDDPGERSDRVNLMETINEESEKTVRGVRVEK